MTSSKIFVFIIGCSIITFGCCKLKKDKIHHQIIDQQYVFITDVATLQTSDDPISNHIDSIIMGQINTQIISTGHQSLDLNTDGISDLYFEIIDLNPYNPNGLPTHFDSLAAKTGSSTIQFVDNSTWGYADALSTDQIIDNNQYYKSNSVVLGTFMNAGNFNGQGNKYLGFRIPNGNKYNYGWIKLYCSQHNDTLRIMEYAYNQTLNKSIDAGQTQ